jgi:GNAT superfamily N-acetyltransferase
MADIDRTIGRDSTATELQDKLKLIVDRLDYLAAPAGAAPMSICTVAVRPLRTNETEFREYFRLRRRVYTAMGYLDEEVENTRSGLEINEADVHAIHLGAFCSDGIRQRLAGTARVVTMDGADSALQRLFEGMTSIDPVAISRLDSPYMLGLPIFQSHSALNPVIGDIFVRNEPCGELSRVIVAPEFRGLGISSRLIDEAVRRSRDRGVQRLFLECLAIHERLYERHGFKRIRGVEGQVVEVGRTMIAMEQRLDASAAILPALGQGAAAGA